MAPPPPPPPRSGAPTATDFRDLTSAISTLSTEMARSRGGRTTTRTSTSGRSSMADSLNKFLRDFDTSVNKLSRSLQKVVSSLQQTQQDFGVNIGAAAQLQINAFKESIESYIASVKSLDFSGLGTATSELGSDLLGAIGNFATGNVQGVAEGIQTATSKFYGKVTAERPGKEPPIQGFDQKLFLQTQKSLQDEFGTINAKVAEDITRTATTQGLNVDQLVKARRIFSTQSRGDMDAAGKAQNKFFTEFEKKGLSGKVALKSIGENAELLARNGARFAGSFARAAADAVKIGVNLSKISQVGDNIISDFEGFLESQAELGAMGFGFDSSRLAEIAETGDDAALFNELRSQLAATGKDITKLRRSERLALEGAFGISISDMLKLSGETPDGEKDTDQLLGDSNSLLTNILTALAPLAKLAPLFTGLLTGFTFLMMGPFLSAVSGVLNLLLSKGGITLATMFAAYMVAKKLWEWGGKKVEEGAQTVRKGETAKGIGQGAVGGGVQGVVIGMAPGAAVTAAGGLLTTFGGPVGAAAGVPLMKTGVGMMVEGGLTGGVLGMGLGASKAYQEGSRLRELDQAPTRQLEEQLRREQLIREATQRGQEYNTTGYGASDRARQVQEEAIRRGQEYMARQRELEARKTGTPPVKKAQGGPIQGPGTSTSDSIPARLSDGEYVVNAKSASVAGNGLLNLINNTKDKRQLLTALLRSISMTPESQFLFDEQKTTNKMTDKYGNVIMRAEGGPVEKPGTTTPKPGLFDRIKNFAKTGTTSVPSVATPTVEQTEEQVNKLDTNSFNKIIEGFNKLAKFGEKLNTTADKITDPDGGLNKVATAGEKKGFMSKLGELTKVLGKQPDGTDGEPKDFMSKLNTITGIFSKKSEQTESSTEGEKKGFISKLSGLADMFSKKSEGTEGESKGFMSKISGLTSMFSKKPGETPDTGEKKGFMSKMGDIAGILGVGKAPGEGGESKTAMSKFSEITGLFAKKQTGPDDKKGFMGTVSGIASIFGKKESEGGGTFAQKALSSAQSIKGVGKFLEKVPGFGGVASAIAGGEGIKGAITSTASAGVGKWVGGLLGSAIPVPGVGTLLGSLAGDWAGKKLGGLMSSAGSGIKNLFARRNNKPIEDIESKRERLRASAMATGNKKIGALGKAKFLGKEIINAPVNIASGLVGKVFGKRAGSMVQKLAPTNIAKTAFKYSGLGLATKGMGKLMGKKNKEAVSTVSPETMTASVPDLSMMIGSQRYTQPEPAPQQAPTVDTRGIEQKLNNFINALQGIQINMDGAQVGKVLVNTSDAAMTTGVFRLQSR